MAKPSQANILESQRIELTNQLADLEGRRRRLTDIVRRPLPEWDETQSARALAQAEVQDRLNGTATAASVADQEAQKRQAYGVAKSEQIDAKTALDSVDIHVGVVKEELARITRELDSISTAKAEREFKAAREKLFDLAEQLREQVIVAGAWGQLANQDPRICPIRLPAFDYEKLPVGWWDSGRHFVEFGRLELQFAVEAKVMELQQMKVAA